MTVILVIYRIGHNQEPDPVVYTAPGWVALRRRLLSESVNLSKRDYAILRKQRSVCVGDMVYAVAWMLRITDGGDARWDPETGGKMPRFGP